MIPVDRSISSPTPGQQWSIRPPAHQRAHERRADADRTTVLSIERSPDYRWLLRRALQRSADFSLVGEALDEQGALELAEHHQPHAVLLDASTATDRRLHLVGELRERHPKTRVVVLTPMPSADLVDAAMARGAAGVIRKGSSLAHVVSQVRLLLGSPAAPRPVALTSTLPPPAAG
jgi:DNA-binding NarL/FixJ family response regulator